MDFSQSSEYNKLINQRWGHIIGDEINTPLGNAGETMYNVLNTVGEMINCKGLSLFDNPYDPIVADLILQESGVSLNNFQLNYSTELSSNVSNLETLCKIHSGDWKASSEYTLALESLIKEPDNVEKSNPEFYQLCKEIFSSFDKNELDNLLNAYGMASKVQGALNKYANVVNWVSECLKFNAMVEAYKQTDDDFKAMLLFATEFINNFASDDVGTNAIYSSYFEDAVNKYADFLNSEKTTELLFNEYFSNGMGKISSVFSGALEKRFISYISEGLGLSGSVLTWAEAVKFGYNTGMTLSNAITNNGDIMDCRELIRATYFLENATYKLLDNFKYNLEQDTNDLTAKHFDAAYKLFQRTNIYSIKTYKKYLEKQQSSFCRGLFHGFNWNYNAAEIEIADILIAQWERTKCHTAEADTSIMLLNAQEGDAKTFKISGNQDVSITDSLGNEVLRIENGKITQGNDDDGISATVLDNMIVIADVNADEHTIKVSSTRDSKADISVQSFDATGNTLKSVLYKDVDISADKTAQCTYSTLSDNDDLISDSETIEPQYSSANSQTILIESIELSQSDITMNINEQSNISVTVNPSNAVPTAFEWISDNTKVATVDSYGNILAKSSGSAKVYCTATDGSGISKCVNVTVRPINITINTFGRSNDKRSLNYDISVANSMNNNIMIAVYDEEGRFCKLLQNVSLTGSIPLIDIDAEYNIKVLIWNNLYDMIPLASYASARE